MEANYCRKSSSKLYLEPIWKTKQDLFSEYCKWSAERNVKRLSIAKFVNVFNEQNLSLYRPKKDEFKFLTPERIVKNYAKELLNLYFSGFS